MKSWIFFACRKHVTYFRTLDLELIAVIVALVLVPGVSAAQYKVIHQFNGTDGADPVDGRLIFDATGNLYGSAARGGASDKGVIFQFTPNTDGSWTEKVLYSFTGGADGSGPLGGVTFDGSGNLYGQAADGGAYGQGAVFKLTRNSDGSWTESVLYSFKGGTDGALPFSEVIFGPDGALYGTTYAGGAYGFGAVYKLAPNLAGIWTEEVLHSFVYRAESAPRWGVIFDAAGNLYGTTTGWWYSNCCGEVYKLIPQSNGSWQYKVVHSFDWNDPAGFSPAATLVFDQAGSLYGTTTSGSGLNCPGFIWNGCGTVFKLTPNSDDTWTVRVLYRFLGGTDSEQPTSGVVFDSAGNLWGTTLHGGDPSCSSFWGGSGCGTVYQLTPNSQGGWNEQLIHLFQGATGGNPWGGLTVHGGKVYGSASGEGTSGSHGAVFELSNTLAADLYLRLVDYPTPVVQGALLTYAFKVWNLGPDIATHEVLTTQVPPGTTFSSITISGTPGIGSCTHPAVGASGPVVCYEGSRMAPNTTWTVRMTVKVTAPAGTVITETAKASDDTLDPNLTNNVALVRNTVK